MVLVLVLQRIAAVAALLLLVITFLSMSAAGSPYRYWCGYSSKEQQVLQQQVVQQVLQARHSDTLEINKERSSSNALA